MEVALYIEGIRDIVKRGGPIASEYEYLTKACDTLMQENITLQDAYRELNAEWIRIFYISRKLLREI